MQKWSGSTLIMHWEMTEKGITYVSDIGAERESDGWAILGCFLDRLNRDEFDVSDGHPLGLQEQVAEILIAATAVDQHAKYCR